MQNQIHNPQGITGVLHRTHGIVELSEGQAFQALYKSTGELKRVEIWQESKPTFWHIVKTFHQKSILMTFNN